MVKTYLKYEPAESFGVVATSGANVVWTPSPRSSGALRYTSAGVAHVPANEDILAWDIKKSELVARWSDPDNKAVVTVIIQSKTDSDVFAAGYSDGSVRLWDAQTKNVIIKFDGHRSAVTRLAFDKSGTRLASGSRDTDIIIWDLVREQGVVRLRGHKEQITGLAFVSPSTQQPQDGEDGVDEPMQDGDATDSFIVSTSKDALIKVWDVASQYCIETHVTQSNGECWALGVDPSQTGCITAGNDGELRVWTLNMEQFKTYTSQLDNAADTKFLIDRGTLLRQGKDRTTAIHFHPKSNYIAVHGSEKAVELWRMRTDSEVKKAMARRRKRAREKAAAAGEKDVDMGNAAEDDISEAAVSDIFVPYVIVRTGGKVTSVSWASPSVAKSMQLLVSTSQNALELYTVPIQPSASKSKSTSSGDPDYTRALSIEMPGHRTDVRSVSLSSDDTMLASASNGSLKVWNLATQSCLRTLDCGYALCCSFLPGDRIVVVGTKSGSLELFDITTSSLISTVEDAHKGAVWAMRVHPDGKSVATGGADKAVKFWRFDVVKDEVPGTKRTTSRLSLTHTRTMLLSDDVLALCFTPDAKCIAVSTLDNTIKVFFVDSLKLYLNLYGHKLPVLHIAIASDSKLLASCSADKNIRLWGLDFGDCHRALFAHDDSIMSLSFIRDPPNPADIHTLFSASKDGTLKTWDADKFQHLQKLSAHHGEIWALAVSRTGETVVTASHDKSLRIWRQSDEPLFLEEEREKELEDLHDAHLAERLDRDARDADMAADETAGDENGQEAAVPSKQTSATLTAGEKITAALEIAHADLLATQEYERDLAEGRPAAPPQRHPLLSFSNTPPEIHLLKTLEAIPAPQLTDALLLLSFSTISPLFAFISIFFERHMNVQLTCRVFFFLLRTHHKQIVASSELRPVLLEIHGRMRRCLNEWKEVMGFNLAGCTILSRRMREQGVKRLEDVEPAAQRQGVKRGFVGVA
ncbi:MAG: hypothetical protein Q9162_000790 [Coniocarpon cinnabarinum]